MKDSQGVGRKDGPIANPDPATAADCVGSISLLELDVPGDMMHASGSARTVA